MNILPDTPDFEDSHAAHIPRRILLVDDAPENLRMLSETLKQDYVIMFALNGEDALRRAKSEPPPDIILLDVIMPGMNGYDVCRNLKEDPQTRDIPVLFITAQNDEWEESRGLSLGAVDYISKPFRSSLVKTRVANQLELKLHRDHLDTLVHERTRELALTREVTIESMATLAEWRDPETGGHIKRTQHYVHTLGDYMRTLPQFEAQLDQDTLELLYLSAPLHDVGKVSIPDAILQKPGRLTEEEFAEMRLHTTRGGDALTSCEQKIGGKNSFLRIAREIAYGHHERWDGKGYPYGIAGENIPLPARLMSIADVYDALTSKRVYKPAMSHEETMRIILEGYATQFDPSVVDALVTVQDKFQAIAAQFADTQ